MTYLKLHFDKRNFGILRLQNLRAKNGPVSLKDPSESTGEKNTVYFTRSFDVCYVSYNLILIDSIDCLEQVKEQPSEETTEDVTLKKPEPDEEQQEDVVLKLKKPSEQPIKDDGDEVEVFTIESKPDQAAPEEVAEKLKIKKKKSKKEAAADELSVTQEVVIEPEPIVVEEIVEDVQVVEKQPEDDQVTIKKPKKKKVKKDEVEQSVSIKATDEKSQPPDDVDQDVSIKKRKEVKFADVKAEETIKVEETVESDNEGQFSVPQRAKEPETEDIETEVILYAMPFWDIFNLDFGI